MLGSVFVARPHNLTLCERNNNIDGLLKTRLLDYMIYNVCVVAVLLSASMFWGSRQNQGDGNSEAIHLHDISGFHGDTILKVVCLSTFQSSAVCVHRCPPYVCLAVAFTICVHS